MLWPCTLGGESGCCGRVHEAGRGGVVGVYTKRAEWVDVGVYRLS